MARDGRRRVRDSPLRQAARDHGRRRVLPAGRTRFHLRAAERRPRHLRRHSGAVLARRDAAAQRLLGWAGEQGLLRARAGRAGTPRVGQLRPERARLDLRVRNPLPCPLHASGDGLQRSGQQRHRAIPLGRSEAPRHAVDRRAADVPPLRRHVGLGRQGQRLGSFELHPVPAAGTVPDVHLPRALRVAVGGPRGADSPSTG